MDMTPEFKLYVDQMSLYNLLHMNRFVPIGDPIFQGDSGKYLIDRLNELRAKDPDSYVNASKQIGW